MEEQKRARHTRRHPVRAFFRGMYTEVAFSGESLRINGRGLLFGLVVGLLVGVWGGLFARLLGAANHLREGTGWAMFLLPLAGLLVVWMYRRGGIKTAGGTDLIIQAARGEQPVSRLLAPVIFAATLLTHGFGGSAGREGAALQLGGSLAELVRKGGKLGAEFQDLAIMCGMSAAFSALFGTPMAAAIFSMEVVSVGIMYYAALVPCVISSLIAHAIATSFGVSPDGFPLGKIPDFTIGSAVEISILAILCALVSILFCVMLHGSDHLYKKFFKNPYLRVFVGGCIVVVLTLLVGDQTYNGTGINIIARCMDGTVRPEAFFLKMLFTAATLGAGYKGGEIVPSLFTGAAFGCLFGNVLGFSPTLCTAVGMSAVFCGVTNCPITSLLISFELFGYDGMPYFLLAIAFSYMLSGYFGLYQSQKIVYSKYKTNYINKKTH